MRDVIPPETARTLPGLFAERMRRSERKVAYRQFDPAKGDWVAYTWRAMGARAAAMQAALRREGLAPGDRVALLRRNSVEWVQFDQAALGLGLVDVPLYVEDRPDNMAWILCNAGAKIVLVGDAEHVERLGRVRRQLGFLQRIVAVEPLPESLREDPLVTDLDHWLQPGDADADAFAVEADDPEALATIVYTSGTTGRPKGVMLSHRNILWNAWAGQEAIHVYPTDVLLSFLPLSHTLERTVGYYLAMMCGCEVAYNRAVPLLAEDLAIIRPTVLICVPRIFEKVHARLQAQLEEKPAFARRLFERAVEMGWQRFLASQGRGDPPRQGWLWPLLDHAAGRKLRERLGGRLRFAISGGAPLPPEIARTFIGLGVIIAQGYGLTEASPVLTVNRLEDNVPESIGTPLRDVELRIGEQDELLARSPGVMQGYWQNPEATREMIDPEGWLHTGDCARIDDDGHVYITGRLKEILVLANGEKVPPADIEMAIQADPLFEQVMVVGDNRPWLSALVVIDRDRWQAEAEKLGFDRMMAETGLDPEACREKLLLERIAACMHAFPGYAEIRRLAVVDEPWTIDNGLLTPTMKLKRHRIEERYRDLIDRLYDIR